MPTHRERHAKRAAIVEQRVREQDDVPTEMRLDKWLWAARFFKTRGDSVQAIEQGKIRRDHDRCKPAQSVKVGDQYTVVRDQLTYNVEVTGLSEQRGPASAAALLYREPEESIAARKEIIALRKASMVNAPQWKGRPSKRQRRKIEDFLADS